MMIFGGDILGMLGPLEMFLSNPSSFWSHTFRGMTELSSHVPSWIKRDGNDINSYMTSLEQFIVQLYTFSSI